jgi:hypothetical protein
VVHLRLYGWGNPIALAGNSAIRRQLVAEYLLVATRNSLARPRRIDEVVSAVTPFTAKPELLSLVFEHLQVPALKAPAGAMLFAAWVVDEQHNMSNLVQECPQY